MRPYRYSVYRVRFGKLRTPEGRPYTAFCNEMSKNIAVPLAF